MALRGGTPIYFPDGDDHPPVCDSKDLMATLGLHEAAEEVMGRSVFERRHSMCSSKNILPNQEHLHLYKYRSLDWNDQNALSKARSLLVHNRIWMAQPATLNDPHDMQFDVVQNSDKDARRSWVRDNAALLPKMSPARRLQLQNRIERQKITPDMLDGLRQAVQADMGVFCVSATPRSVTMWSHYAAEHKGFCVQYSTFEDELFMLAKQVIYGVHYPLVTIPSNPVVQEHYLIKSPDWSYEREWRIVCPINICSVQLRPAAVSGIIFGAKVEDKTVHAVMGLLKERERLGKPTVKTYIAYVPKTNFGVKIARFA